MTRSTGALVLTLWLIATSASAEGGPGAAYVRAGEDGQALLWRRLEACYAVTPEHVLGGELFASLRGGGDRQARGDGDLLQTFGYDLSILRVSGELAQSCGGAMSGVPNVESRLRSNALAVVATVNEDGSITRRSAVVNDVGLLNVRVRPRRTADELSKRMSGSPVYVDDEPVGMLMAVDSETGVGRVLRMDRLMETVRPFFGAPATSLDEARNADEGEASGTVGRPGDLAADARGGAVAAWTSDPLSAEHRTTNLIDAAEGETIWYGVRPEFPTHVVIDLAGKEARVIDTVELVGVGVTPSARLPRDFEILSSLDDEGGWTVLASGTYFERDERKIVSFMPTRARRIMLRFYSNWGATDAIGLSAVRVSEGR